MNAISIPAPRFSRISSWLGQSRIAVDLADLQVSGNPVDHRHAADQSLFAQIGDFLAAHDLSPTTAHFDVARRYVLGDDLRLTQAIEHELAHDGRIDAAFLVRFAATAQPDPLGPDRIAAMADTLATRLSECEATFRQGHASARDYHIQLSAEVDGVAADPDAAVERLIALTGEAIIRTQELAGQLEANHLETDRLRSNLQEARRAADEDHLTGLPNRRCFDARLHALAPQLDGEEMHCVALCDVDNFKAINDRHGHDTGDRVLRVIARQLTGELGKQVLVARHGGEEFGCLFERCDIDAAVALLDGARETLGGRNLVNQASGEGIGRVTFSAGITVLGADPSESMRTADAALYAAKRQGKDRIIAAA